MLARHLAALGGRSRRRGHPEHTSRADRGDGRHSRHRHTVYKAPDKEFEQDRSASSTPPRATTARPPGGATPTATSACSATTSGANCASNCSLTPTPTSCPTRASPARSPCARSAKRGRATTSWTSCPTDGKPSTLFLDPKTFLIAREEHFDDNVRVVTTVSGLPHRQRRPISLRPDARPTARPATTWCRTSRRSSTTRPSPTACSPCRPRWAARRRSLTPGATSATASFTLDDGEITLPVQHQRHGVARVSGQRRQRPGPVADHRGLAALKQEGYPGGARLRRLDRPAPRQDHHVRHPRRGPPVQAWPPSLSPCRRASRPA